MIFIAEQAYRRFTFCIRIIVLIISRSISFHILDLSINTSPQCSRNLSDIICLYYRFLIIDNARKLIFNVIFFFLILDIKAKNFRYVMNDLL